MKIDRGELHQDLSWIAKAGSDVVYIKDKLMVGGGVKGFVYIDTPFQFVDRAITVRLAPFLKLISTVSDQEVDLVLKDRLHIKTGSSSATLSLVEFPGYDDPFPIEFKITPELVSMVRTAAVFVDSNLHRGALAGICIKNSDVFGGDGVHIFWGKMKKSCGSNVVLNPTVVQMIDDTMTSFGTSMNNACFSNGRVRVYSPLIDGEYPDVGSVYKKNASEKEAKYSLFVHDIKSVLYRAREFSQDGSVLISKGVIIAEGPHGRFEEKVMEGSSVEKRVDIDRLIKCVNLSVEVDLRDNSLGVIVFKGYNYRVLLSPMQL